MSKKNQAKQQLKKLKKLQKKSLKTAAALAKLQKKSQKMMASLSSFNEKIEKLGGGIVANDAQYQTLTQQVPSATSGGAQVMAAAQSLAIPTPAGSQQLSILPKVNTHFTNDKWHITPATEWARTPYKSNPCKKCPAKMGGLCKCAIAKRKM